MSRVAHLIMQLSYVGGVLSLVLVLLMAFVSSVAWKLHVTTRGGLVFACTLFFCTIASYLVGKAGDKS
jgi:hypothetical protein